MHTSNKPGTYTYMRLVEYIFTNFTKNEELCACNNGSIVPFTPKVADFAKTISRSF